MRTSLLSTKLHVSAITLRKNLVELESQGLVIRKHGSLVLFESPMYDKGENEGMEYPFHIRILGQHTNLHIAMGETVFLDHRAVSHYVADTIPPFSSITIVTNSLSILEVLKKRNYSYPVLVTGNCLSLPNNRFFLREKEGLPDSVTVHNAFICCSLYKNHTFYLDEREDASTIEALCLGAEKLYIILESGFIDVLRKQVFKHRQFTAKIQEEMVDDGIGSAKSSLIPPSPPRTRLTSAGKTLPTAS